MAAQSGTTWALSVKTGASTYSALAGLRTRSFKINNNPFDVTTADSTARWRELLGDTGQVELEIDAAGLYQKGANDHVLPSLVVSGASQTFQLVSASASAGVTILGTFVVTEYQLTAAYDGAVTFTVKLMSTGQPTITYSPVAATVVP